MKIIRAWITGTTSENLDAGMSHEIDSLSIISVYRQVSHAHVVQLVPERPFLRRFPVVGHIETLGISIIVGSSLLYVAVTSIYCNYKC
jgi:hypothetical protein